jgi:malate dehydrogenase (oxaloacetate-decarboxylating)
MTTERRTHLTTGRGATILNDPVINKGTAFTPAERADLGIDGLLPPRVETLDEQCARIRVKYDAFHRDLERHVFLRALQDINEVLFYAFVENHLEEMLPIVYTPTVGDACRQFSHIYRRPHGLFLAYPDRARLADQLADVDRDIDVIVVTDGQRILGLGDQGLGGMGIPIGKLSLYTAVGGIDPSRTLPILLDVGTDNADLIADPLYLGWRHERVTGRDYDEFVETFVTAVMDRFPGVLLQWEDFASTNATPLLERYRDRLLSFNDDIQGTAAVALAAVLGALRVSDSTLEEQTILIVGAGSAGTGIGGMLADTVARSGSPTSPVFLIDQAGVLHDGRNDLEDYQRRFARPQSEVAAWADATDLATIVEHLRPTVMIGVSGQPGIFTEAAVTAMAAASDRPIIMALSNPTSRAEATPQDLLDWSDGRALVATGSPFSDVERDGIGYRISQSNNVYVFPGLGLGALAAGATRVTDAMLVAAAAGVAEASPCPADPTLGILPPLDSIRATSRRIAVAVAMAAGADGVAPPLDVETATARVDELWWDPVYPTIQAV